MGTKNLIKGEPLKFGDTKQIEFLRKKTAHMDEVLTSGIDFASALITIDVAVRIKFNCFQCDHLIDEYEVEQNDISPNNEIYNLIEQNTVTCANCKNQYYFESGFITLISNPTRPEMITRLEGEDV